MKSICQKSHLHGLYKLLPLNFSCGKLIPSWKQWIALQQNEQTSLITVEVPQTKDIDGQCQLTALLSVWLDDSGIGLADFVYRCRIHPEKYAFHWHLECLCFKIYEPRPFLLPYIPSLEDGTVVDVEWESRTVKAISQAFHHSVHTISLKLRYKVGEYGS